MMQAKPGSAREDDGAAARRDGAGTPPLRLWAGLVHFVLVGVAGTALTVLVWSAAMVPGAPSGGVAIDLGELVDQAVRVAIFLAAFSAPFWAGAGVCLALPVLLLLHAAGARRGWAAPVALLAAVAIAVIWGRDFERTPWFAVPAAPAAAWAMAGAARGGRRGDWSAAAGRAGEASCEAGAPARAPAHEGGRDDA